MVTDLATGCTASCSATVTDNTSNPTVTCSATNITSCLQPNGSVTATANGVSYLWDNGATTSSQSGLAAGTYTVVVTDLATGCTASCSATIANNLSNPTVTCSSTDNTSCVLPNGSVTATATGVSYLWDNGATTSSQSGLSAGTYTVVVTDLATGCTASCSATVADNTSNPTVTCSATDITSCVQSNGSVTATAAGVSYSWSNGSTNAIQNDLAAGTYTVVVTDLATGCTASCSATVANNTSNPTVTCSATDNTSCVLPNGSVTATATGVSYLWDNGVTTSSQIGLAAGTYTVVITDLATGCTASCSVTVANNTSNPTVTCSATDITSCVQPNGSVTATARGVSYLWDNGVTTSSQIGLAAGTYTVVITDLATGCTASCSVTVANNTSNPTVTCSATDNTSCTQPNGSVTATASGVSYLWNNGATTLSQSGLSAGTYTVVVTDLATGCTASCSATVANNTSNPTVTCSATDNTSCVLPNGSVTATATGVSYLWDNGVTTSSQIGLAAGTYTVVITDLATGCTASCSVTVANNTSNPTVTCSATDITSCVQPNGSVTATASGVSFLWDNGTTTSSQSGLSAGTYTVVVTDLVTGCTSSCSATVANNTSNPTVTCSSTDNTSCVLPNGSVTATATGVSYLWDNGATTSSQIGLAAGTYTVVVTDLVTGCTASCSATVANNTSNPTVTCSATDNTSCTQPNGSVTATATGVSYSWSNGSTNAIQSGLAAGTYTVVVTDLATGCTASCSATVNANAINPSVTCSATNNTSCGIPNGTVSATAAGVSYLWSNGSTDASQSVLSAGTYTVVVTDLVTGCTASCSATVNANTINPSVTCSATNNTSCGIPNGTVSATAAGVSYLWSNGSTDASQSVLSAGTYTVVVTDLVTGCTASCTATVNANAINPSLTCSATNNISCGIPNGTVSATAAGVSYLWSNGSTDASQSGLSTGTYTVVVTDLVTGCTASCSATITSPTPLGVSLTPVHVACNTVNTGSIGSTISGGTPVFTYLWSNGSTNTNLSGLIAGTYTITVTDGNGCTASASAIVSSGGSAPAMPGVVSGLATVCRNSSQVYSIVAVPGATSYTWTLPSGASISLGAGTTSITVFFSNAAVSGNISVTASNICGTSTPRTLFVTVVNTVPAMPTITGLQRGLCNRTGVVYSCSVSAGATSYTWTVPTGATIVSGQGTTSITVNFAGTFTNSGFVTVKANNICGSSSVRSYPIYGQLVSPTIIGSNTACKWQTGVAYSCTPVTGALSYTWTVVPGSTLVSGQGTTNIVVNWGHINGIITCKANATTTCATSVTATHPVSFTCRAGNELLSSLFLYPNPANANVLIDFDAFESGEGNIQLYNLLGAEVYAQSIALAEGQNRFNFDVSNLASGCYIVKVTSKGTTQMARLIVE
ncbi:MAG: T9SS type A sorting domain-containing protein [Bacteroidetes bacterium]|nr:T9SS type A sorting domain-containing protein [Bacteroidota bacterium]